MSKDARDIIIQPIVSEKSYAQAERGKYTFLVAPKATKLEIRSAVEQIWGVHVQSVNTFRRKGKEVRRHWVRGRRPDSRRAVVTLHAGEKIAIFEGS